MWILPCNHAKLESLETVVHGVCECLLFAVHAPDYACYFKLLE